MISRFYPDMDGEMIHDLDGDFIKVDDIESRLKELRSEFLNDKTGERRFVVERIASEFGINFSK